MHPQYYYIYDDNFITVNAKQYVDKIKLWSRLYKSQPNNKALFNQLDYINNTFEMKVVPHLNVMDVNPVRASDCTYISLVENQYVSISV